MKRPLGSHVVLESYQIIRNFPFVYHLKVGLCIGGPNLFMCEKRVYGTRVFCVECVSTKAATLKMGRTNTT
jgi:hypothetical protein